MEEIIKSLEEKVLRSHAEVENIRRNSQKEILKARISYELAVPFERNKVFVIDDGAVELYHDNALKLTTSSTGITITGTGVGDGWKVGDSEYFTAGIIMTKSTEKFNTVVVRNCFRSKKYNFFDENMVLANTMLGCCGKQGFIHAGMKLCWIMNCKSCESATDVDTGWQFMKNGKARSIDELSQAALEIIFKAFNCL